jgi:phasin family protein
VADSVKKVRAVKAPAKRTAIAASAAPAPVKTKRVEPLNEGTKTMTDTVKQVEETVKKATAEAGEKATAMFKDVTARAKEAFEKSGETTKDVIEFHKANFEALIESGKIAAQGAQTAAQNAADYGRKNWDATTAHVKAVAAVKSPTDALKLQGDFARSQFDGAVAEMSKSTEFYLKLAGEVFQPIQNRYSVAAEQMKARFAA